MIKFLSLSSAVTLLFGFLSACGPPPGQRLLHIEISHKEQVLLEGIRGVNDDTPVDKMGEILEDVNFENVGEVPDPQTSANQKWGISGEVVVRILHVDNVLATASLLGLDLERPNSSEAWKLSPAEADRVRAALAP